MPLLYWLLDTAVVNSYLMSRKCSNSKTSYKEFREQLAWALVQSAEEESRSSRIVLKEKVNRSIVSENFTLDRKRKDPVAHFQKAGKRGRCEWCRVKVGLLKTQTGDPYRVTSYCEYCDVPLCTDPKRDYFRKYHIN
jgi:hypothetical protein